MKVDMVHTPRNHKDSSPRPSAPSALKAWPRRAKGRTVSAVEQQAPELFIHPGPIHPPQSRGAGPPAGPHARTEGGASGRAPGGWAHHATRDVPWREAALGA